MKTEHLFATPRFSSRLLSFASLLSLACLAGCGPMLNDPKDSEDREIEAFTVLADGSIAVRIHRFGGGFFQDMGPTNLGTFYALIERNPTRIRIPDALLASAAPTLPGFFYGCEGAPVTLQAPIRRGADGACYYSDAASGASAGGKLVGFANTWPPRITVLGESLQVVDSLPGSRVLEMDEQARTVTAMTFSGSGGTPFFYRLHLDGSHRVDSADVKGSVPVQVQGVGRRLVCSQSQRALTPEACWQPEGVSGFADSVLAKCSLDRCEWSPATRTLARSEWDRIVFSRLDGSKADTVITRGLLDRVAAPQN